MENSENFDSVELTEAEKRELLEKATNEKRRKLREQEYMRKVSRPLSIPNFNAENFKKWAINRWESLYKKQWIKTPENEQITNLLSQYFSQSPEFEQDGRSFKKGLLLAGSVGVGKTTLMQLFGRNPVSSFIIVPCRRVANEYAEQGGDVIGGYCMESYPSSDNPFRHETFGLCFDDLGTETRKKNYGNELNVMEEILLNRYDRRAVLQNKTHITTNLTADMIKEMYGERVASRMREMFNIIIFEGDLDMRN